MPTPEEEKKKRELFEAMSPRRQQRILKKGYDRWDPFQMPKEPPVLMEKERRDKEHALMLFHRYIAECSVEMEPDEYFRGVKEMSEGITAGGDRYRGGVVSWRRVRECGDVDPEGDPLVGVDVAGAGEGQQRVRPPTGVIHQVRRVGDVEIVNGVIGNVNVSDEPDLSAAVERIAAANRLQRRDAHRDVRQRLVRPHDNLEGLMLIAGQREVVVGIDPSFEGPAIASPLDHDLVHRGGKADIHGGLTDRSGEE